MGCLCSKGTDVDDYVAEYHDKKEKEQNEEVIAPCKREEVTIEGKNGLHSRSKTTLESNVSSTLPEKIEANVKMKMEKADTGHRRHSTMDSAGVKKTMPRIVSIRHSVKGEQVAAGWPSWLASVAGEAVKGWTPRSADSYEKLQKIGQGTYSSVYMARDLTTGKAVAMKKVRFVNMDPESVRFMAREICILRRLDHPNVMKLQALVTSKVSGSLYLVFDYMEHDLAGLVASPGVKFTEPQIKCYMQQILHGLEHCHSQGVLHRDIKGANILVDDQGTLKIGDFGLATIVDPGQKQPLTSRVVTLWYRAPELLLGATEYGPAIDLWSVGCILAEVFAGKPIMPGRTEVEQMHKIFKLCGSPTEEYWRKIKLPHATGFKSQRTYKRRVSDTFKDFPSSALALLEVLLSIDPDQRGTAAAALKSEFFTTKPLPCDPSRLPRYPPSKEFDARNREEEAKRRRGESVKGHGAEYASKHTSKQKAIQEGQEQSNKSVTYKYNPHEDSGTCFPSRGNLKHRSTQSKSVIHPNAVGFSYKKIKDESGHSVHGGTFTKESQVHQSMVDSSYHPKQVGRTLNNDSTGYAPTRDRIRFSGPLMPPGGNMDDMLKEHERHIQEAVRKARLGKVKTKKNGNDLE